MDSIDKIEDSANKVMAQFFGNELLPYFEIEGEIDHIGPNEITHLELKKFYQDFNFVMKDGSWTHFEFQSTDKGIKDLKRFRSYEALTSQQFDVDVKTYVLYSGTIETPKTEFTSGFNTYRVKPIIMKGHRAEEVFENISNKLERHISLTKEDIVPLTLCPLMGGNLPQKERIQKAFELVRQTGNTIPEVGKIEAVLYAMANKFLDEVDMNAVKEDIKMSPLGRIIYNDGIADGISQGISQNAIENARNLLINGVSFELVCASITGISEEDLQKIYDEVKASESVI